MTAEDLEDDERRRSVLGWSRWLYPRTWCVLLLRADTGVQHEFVWRFGGFAEASAWAQDLEAHAHWSHHVAVIVEVIP